MAIVDVDTERSAGSRSWRARSSRSKRGSGWRLPRMRPLKNAGSRAQRKAKRKGRKLERRLEKAAKKLPVDTPVDKRRHGRTAGRAAWVVRLVLAGRRIIATIYVASRARNRREGTAEAGPAPDTFGATVEASEDGEQASTTTITEG